MRFFLHIGFDGTNYSGWQRQKNTSNTIQEVFENALHKMFKKQITVYGCGRTDAGVHASQYIMHIDLDETPAFDLKFRLNKNLPPDIAVYEVIKISEDIHCRYDAISRTYDYFLHWVKDPALIRYSSFYEDRELNFQAMLYAAKIIYQTKDFKALCKRPELYDHTLCHVSACNLFINEQEGRMRFTITANRFLRGMVRLSIFFLLKVGSGELSPEEFKKIMSLEMEYKNKQPALPNGLFLSHVQYPNLSFSNNHHLIQMLQHGLN